MCSVSSLIINSLFQMKPHYCNITLSGSRITRFWHGVMFGLGLCTDATLFRLIIAMLKGLRGDTKRFYKRNERLFWVFIKYKTPKTRVYPLENYIELKICWITTKDLRVQIAVFAWREPVCENRKERTMASARGVQLLMS